jgi:hypothetical protein
MLMTVRRCPLRVLVGWKTRTTHDTTTVVATATTSTATSKRCKGGNSNNRIWNHDDGTRRSRLGRNTMLVSPLVGFVSSCGKYSRITKRFKNTSSAASEDCEKHQQQQMQKQQKKHRVIPDTRGIPDDVVDLVNVSPLLKTV